MGLPPADGLRFLTMCKQHFTTAALQAHEPALRVRLRCQVMHASCAQVPVQPSNIKGNLSYTLLHMPCSACGCRKHHVFGDQRCITSMAG